MRKESVEAGKEETAEQPVSNRKRGKLESVCIAESWPYPGADRSVVAAPLWPAAREPPRSLRVKVATDDRSAQSGRAAGERGRLTLRPLPLAGCLRAGHDLRPAL